MKITPSVSTKMSRGRAEILLRISLSHSGQYRAKTHLFIMPDRLQDGRIIIPRTRIPEYNEIVDVNNRLSALLSHLTSVLLNPSIKVNSSADVQRIIDNYYNPEVKQSSFWSAWDTWEAQAKVGDLRKRRYKVVRLDLQRFEDWRHRPLTLDMTSKEVLQFEQFLRDEHKWNTKAQKRGDNVVKSLMSVLRTFVNYCIKTCQISASPFGEYTMPKEIYGTPYYLTLEERDKIADMDYGSTHLNNQRDVFVFQCLVGCRVGDLLRLTHDNIVDGVLEYTPHKTMEHGGSAVRVPLNERAQTIVSRYATGYKLLPFISAQKYNDTIKVLCMRAGIDRVVTVINPISKEEERKPIYEVASSHMARRTFIGNLYRQVQDPNLIGSMSGHAEGSRAFSRYRQIDEDVKRKVVDLIK